MSNFLHTVANEPTVGLYHVQEHIRRSVPKLVDMKKDLQKTNQRLEDVNGASDYSLETIKLLQDMSTLGSICRSLEESIARTEQIMAGVPYTESTLSQGPTMTTAAVVASQRVEGATAAASPVSAVVDSGFAIKQF